ncbi:MAG: DUF262 domain-containing protein [Treponema sp.]
MKKLDTAGLQLISIDDILTESFFIPSYQRGYRWGDRQVIDLLTDILEFIKKQNKNTGEFYCLQPIVVTKKDAQWCVIDGQQRLTTIYIMLKFLEDAKKILFPTRPIFSLSYETRDNSRAFLEKIQQITGIDRTNADYYHISRAYLTIKKWFEEKEEHQEINRGDFLNALIKTDYRNKGETDNANNVRFIWYTVSAQGESTDDKEIFRKINMGKIPLTNAELIKALFFTTDADETEKEKRQSRLAYEWNAIEDALQNEDFWSFLNKTENQKNTRIEFLFGLVAEKNKNKLSNVYRKNDGYYTFYIFNDLLHQQKESIDSLWEEVKNYFRILKEWFDDNEYYHLIGYLIHSDSDMNINTILQQSKDLSKTNFKQRLKESIKSSLAVTEESIQELHYYENKKQIGNILFLFNVISTMKAGNIFFSFKRYIDEKWSLEHIHAQNSDELHTDQQRRLLLEEQRNYYDKINDAAVITKIHELLTEKEINTEKFENLQNEIFLQFSTTQDETGERLSLDNNSIDNLALLSSVDNSSLSNNIFPIKRDKIIELDSKGAFIPLCTKNVFLKYYSKDVTQNVIWTQKDREAYLSAIKDTLFEYIEKGRFVFSR